MTDAPESGPEDPFHEGEREIQSRLGVRENLSRRGGRAIRDHMIDQHRAFYEQIPDLYYGACDSDGDLWASMLWGEPGFMTTPDAKTLSAEPNVLPGDPAFSTLMPGNEVGILGLMHHTRRRNRASGTVRHRTTDSLVVDITQSFGNCPKYIQSRDASQSDASTTPAPVITTTDTLGAVHQQIIRSADTFFIATQYAVDDNVGQGGVDMSHRGGNSGFVAVEDDQHIIWPDFAGNRFFNTLGNLIKNPQAGLLFMDYANGDVLWMTGTAEIIWDDEAKSGFAGAERLTRFKTRKLVHATHALPWQWSASELSPFLETTGSWPK